MSARSAGRHNDRPPREFASFAQSAFQQLRDSEARGSSLKGALAKAMNGGYERIYAVVRQIPRGRVATYGQIARIAGIPGHARQVGYALNALPESRSVPWHRVINAKGEISPRSVTGSEKVQRALLEHEAVKFDEKGRVSFRRFRWKRGAW